MPLDQPGRERVQLALTSLGFDTRGTDGIFGARSREMISAWQKARNQSATGFLSGAQQEALLKEAAPALAKHEEQKKADEESQGTVRRRSAEYQMLPADLQRSHSRGSPPRRRTPRLTTGRI